MYVFYALVLVVVVIAYVRIHNATGEIKVEKGRSKSSKMRKTKQKKSVTEPYDFWWFPSEGGGADGGGFDGGSSQGGDGSSTGF